MLESPLHIRFRRLRFRKENSPWLKSGVSTPFYSLKADLHKEPDPQDCNALTVRAKILRLASEDGLIHDRRQRIVRVPGVLAGRSGPRGVDGVDGATAVFTRSRGSGHLQLHLDPNSYDGEETKPYFLGDRKSCGGKLQLKNVIVVWDSYLRRAVSLIQYRYPA